MGTLNFQLYLLAVNSDLYSHNKGWQESLGSELIFIPTIAAHTNQPPLLDIYCFAQRLLLCSSWKQRTGSIMRIKQVVCFPWSLHTLVFCYEATVHQNFSQPLLNESQQISLCCSSKRTYQGSYFLPSVRHCQDHGAVLIQDPAPVPWRCQKVLLWKWRAKINSSKTAESSHTKDYITSVCLDNIFGQCHSYKIKILL